VAEACPVVLDGNYTTTSSTRDGKEAVGRLTRSPATADVIAFDHLMEVIDWDGERGKNLMVREIYAEFGGVDYVRKRCRD
jgi:hypothetical protein